jgi:hypothetical protein
VDEEGRAFEAVWWSALEYGAATPVAGDRIELAYSLERNIWQDSERLQLVVKDLRRVNSE